VRFSDNPFPGPLPKLRLRSPKLLAVAADDERCFLLFLLFLGFNRAHVLNRSINTLPSQHVFSFANRGEWQHAVPVREASARGGVSFSKRLEAGVARRRGRRPRLNDSNVTTTISRSALLFASRQT
jgi:hypothetical protein